MPEARVQVNIPLQMLTDRLEDVLAASINPEIYFSATALESIDHAVLRDLAKALKGGGLRTTIHGPFMDLSPGGVDERVREVTAERFMALMEAVVPFRPASVVLHASYDEKRFDGDVSLWLSQSLKTWAPVVREAEKAGAVIAVENTFEYGPAEMKLLVEEVASGNFGVCLDAGHINAFSKAGMDEWFSGIGAHVKEVHIHDNSGTRDEHLPVGDGNIDFSRFFGLLREFSPEPVYTIEPHGEGVLERALTAVRSFI